LRSRHASVAVDTSCAALAVSSARAWHVRRFVARFGPRRNSSAFAPTRACRNASGSTRYCPPDIHRRYGSRRDGFRRPTCRLQSGSPYTLRCAPTRPDSILTSDIHRRYGWRRDPAFGRRVGYNRALRIPSVVLRLGPTPSVPSATIMRQFPSFLQLLPLRQLHACYSMPVVRENVGWLQKTVLTLPRLELAPCTS
jgi:hypothetical protein